jgi:hypothetical protein
MSIYVSRSGIVSALGAAALFGASTPHAGWRGGAAGADYAPDGNRVAHRKKPPEWAVFYAWRRA